MVLIAAGALLWANDFRPIGMINVGVGVVMAHIAGGLFVTVRTVSSVVREPSRVEGLELARQRELLRGTSLHLRDMKYRYSIHFDDTGRAPFTMVINTITLGFLPVMILDNQSDRQGEGYVAFPFDGERWRGPGLPCVGGPEEAIAHAARCVSPLEQEEGNQ